MGALVPLSTRLVRESLDKAVVLEVLVHVQRVQELGIEAGEQHVHDDGDVDSSAQRGSRRSATAGL